MAVMRLTWLCLLLVSLTLLGCQSKTIRNPEATQKLIFPYGTYQHSIDLTILAPNQPPREMNFRGVAKVNAELVNMVALSPMNTSVFRIQEDRRAGQLKSEVYLDSLKPMQPQIEQFYGLVRTMLTTPTRPQGRLQELVLATDLGPAKIQFLNYDEHNIPALVTVDNAKFRMKIHVTGYEL